jgi:hypothetical protein
MTSSRLQGQAQGSNPAFDTWFFWRRYALKEDSSEGQALNRLLLLL